MQDLLVVSNLKKMFSNPESIELLKGINLTLKENEAIAIMGASGEGKITLLHILASLEDYDQGEILFHGKPLKMLNISSYRQKKIGLIFQSYNLIEDLSVLENVLLPMRLQRQVSYERARFLVKEVGLENRASFPAKVLSGGEKQRAAIARAFANDPDLLFADEPSGNLDHQNAQKIHQLLLNFVKKLKKALIVVTHNMDLAARCDSIYLLEDGIIRLKSN